MDESSQLERIRKSIRGLSMAVWCLVGIMAVQTAAWLVPFVAPNLYMKYLTPTTPDMPRQSFESWDGLTFDEKVNRASVILLTENRPEGGKIRAIIREELKRKSGTTLHYSVGDEYLPASILEPKENTRYGDGSLILLQGSPAVSSGSYSIYNGSIPGLGEMPLSKVRELIAKSK
jgi:hypothetical protein